MSVAYNSNVKLTHFITDIRHELSLFLCLVSCIFNLLSRGSDQKTVTSLLRTVSHLSTTLRGG